MDRKVLNILKSGDDVPYLSEEEFKHIAGVPGPDEIGAFLKEYSDFISSTETTESMRLAKRFLLHDNLYSMAPLCRPYYVRALLKGERSDVKTDADYISALMQTVYGLDMNMKKMDAVLMLVGIIQSGKMVRDGSIVMDKDGNIRPSDEELARCEEAIEAKDPVVCALAAGAEAVASQIVGKSDIDDIFMSMSYLGPCSEKDTPESTKYVEALSSAFRRVFGEAEKGVYVCPVDKEAVELCIRVTEREFGKKLPEFKVMVDTRNPFPYYHAGEGICVPHLLDTLGLVHSISSMTPVMLMKRDEPNVMDVSSFIKDRNGCFKKMCWETGSQSRVTEKSMAACSVELLGTKRDRAGRFAKEYMRGTLSRAPSLEGIMDPVSMFSVGVQNVIDHHVYYAMSYPVGWMCMRDLDVARFRSLTDAEAPWKDPAFSWNSGFSKEEGAFIGRVLGVQKKRASRIESDPEVAEALKTAYDDWGRLWLGQA